MKVKKYINMNPKNYAEYCKMENSLNGGSAEEIEEREQEDFAEEIEQT